MPSASKLSFNFLSMEELEKRYIEELKGALEKKYGSEDNFPRKRKEQLDLFQNTLTTLKNYAGKVSDEEKILVYIGLNRTIKKEIANTYWFRSPDNSVLHKALDHAMGISEGNILDEKTEKAAIKAYKLFDARRSMETYKTIYESTTYAKLKNEVMPSLMDADHQFLHDGVKITEKQLKDTMNIITGNYPKLRRNELAKNKRIDDNHDLGFYGLRALRKNYLFFITPASKENPVSKEETVQFTMKK